MIPKIIFRRSSYYDKALFRPKGILMPSDAIFQKKIKILEKKWRVVGPKILRELERVAKLKWQEKDIDVYVTYGVIPYSDPLTLHLEKQVDDMIDTLTHELIHRLVEDESVNWVKVKRNWNLILNKHKRESESAKGHIVTHAIHEHILRKFFGAERLNKQMKFIKWRDHIRSWQIVKEVGCKNIINDLTINIK